PPARRPGRPGAPGRDRRPLPGARARSRPGTEGRAAGGRRGSWHATIFQNWTCVHCWDQIRSRPMTDADPTTIRHRQLPVGEISMHIAEAGSGPLVLLCHGFPECWYSWRHQLVALARAGYHAVAPDMRGYGRTSAPEPVEAYTIMHLVGDLVGLLGALGQEQAVVVGHDWGSLVAWNAALLRPDRFRAVVGMSVP